MFSATRTWITTVSCPSRGRNLRVWLGAGARKLLGAAAHFTAGAVLPQTIGAYCDRETFAVGPFQITPFLMDHSAYGAHALRVEADGQRLF